MFSISVSRLRLTTVLKVKQRRWITKQKTVLLKLSATVSTEMVLDSCILDSTSVVLLVIGWLNTLSKHFIAFPTFAFVYRNVEVKFYWIKEFVY